MPVATEKAGLDVKVAECEMEAVPPVKIPDRDEKVRALGNGITIQLILLKCPSYEDWRLRIEPHALVDDPHGECQALDVLERRLAVSHNLIDLGSSKHLGQ